MRYRMFLLLFVALLVIGFGFMTAKDSFAGYWITAYNVDVVFWDPWYNPHYGASFSGCEGSNQYFDGPSGAPPEYSSWDWWGSCYYVLLLEKSWLNANVCGYHVCADRFDGNYHHAYMAYH